MLLCVGVVISHLLGIGKSMWFMFYCDFDEVLMHDEVFF